MDDEVSDTSIGTCPLRITALLINAAKITKYLRRRHVAEAGDIVAEEEIKDGLGGAKNNEEDALIPLAREDDATMPIFPKACDRSSFVGVKL